MKPQSKKFCSPLDIWVHLPALGLRKSFVFFPECDLEFNVHAFIKSAGLVPDTDAHYTYFLDGKNDLRNFNNAGSLVKPGAVLHLVNTKVLSDSEDSSSSVDQSIENSEELEKLKVEVLSA